jgi:hypothetical protein
MDPEQALEDRERVIGPTQLWVVVRDGRGGVGWLTRTVQVR